MALDTKKSITRFDAVDEVRYVVFRLGTEKFGARIEHLKEVLLIKDITAVPRAQEFVLGVINLRGVVCTIVDLGSRLNVRREEGEVEKLAAAETRSAIIVEIGKNILGMA
ncbi:MAG: chemotaxis protein CheW, partial [Candidatus Heimdallarchaeota archaeon]